MSTRSALLKAASPRIIRQGARIPALALHSEKCKMATDYHDFKITELERIAEEQISKAEIALGTGENDATELVRRWSKILTDIRQIKEHGRDSSVLSGGTNEGC